MNWQPSAPLAHLKFRATLIQQIRAFFAEREILEVETPVLCRTSVTDPYIESISTTERYYLQTSPEYAMKRLLAAGIGDIYQITKAFREEECGRFHNPEFTLLEWYRVGFDHYQLMNEVDEFLQRLLKTAPAHKVSYAEIFQACLQIDPHRSSLHELIACAHAKSINVSDINHNRDTWLQLLMMHEIEPKLGIDRPCFIYDFPASQSALAKIQAGDPDPIIASRFEVYLHGIELANGFHELNDASEQRKRFEENLRLRQNLGLPYLPIDELFLTSLSHLPNCAGVALGIDRLVLLALHANHINEVISFDFSRV